MHGGPSKRFTYKNSMWALLFYSSKPWIRRLKTWYSKTNPERFRAMSRQGVVKEKI
jgi:hypothetical protein